MNETPRPARAPVRVAIVGLRRGAALARILAAHPDSRVVALCDRSPDRLRWAGESFSELDAALCTDLDQVLAREVDAVVLANDATAHVPLAVAALEAGVHVLSEVPACATMGEAVRLVETAERSEGLYMMAENYCFGAVAAEMRRRYRAGDIGAAQHGEGEYVHDTERIWPQLTGGLREHWRNRRSSTFYCTHSLGPLLHMTDSRVTRVVAMETPNRVGVRYGRPHGDSAVLICQTSGGATVKSLQSHGGLRREPPSAWLCLYGTEGMMEADRWNRQRVNVYVGSADEPTVYEPDLLDLSDLAGYEDVARKFLRSHGGSDFAAIHAFVQAALGRRAPEIDAFRAVDMTIPGLLGFRSIMDGNVPYDVPDLRDRAARERWRDDSWAPAATPDPRTPAVPYSSFPVPEIPDEIYAGQREIASGMDYPPVERM